MPANTTDLEKRLWDAADELRANSKLKSSEYSVPVLGLIFLRYADYRFSFISNIVRLYRGEEVETVYNSALLKENFPEGQYIDVAGLCNVATIDEIKEQGWSLNPGRYVGVAEKEEEDFDFAERLEELNEELEILNVEARELEERIAENVVKLLES